MTQKSKRKSIKKKLKTLRTPRSKARVHLNVADEFDTPEMDLLDRLSDKETIDEVFGDAGERHLRLRGN